jgi:hypothetical protein
MASKPILKSPIPQKLALQRIEAIEATPASGGKTKLLQYLNGERLSRGASLVAKCYECQGYYVDGRYDCEIPLCPLYPYMPFKGKSRLRDERDD